MSRFKDKVIKVVKSVPKGKVVSYGQVALYVGIPRAARQVGWTLNRMKGAEDAPWWRVVNNQGRISIKGSKYTAADQMDLLRKESIEISDDLTFDIEKYRFVPSAGMLKKFELDPLYISTISKRLPYANYFPSK